MPVEFGRGELTSEEFRRNEEDLSDEEFRQKKEMYTKKKIEAEANVCNVVVESVLAMYDNKEITKEEAVEKITNAIRRSLESIGGVKKE